MERLEKPSLERRLVCRDALLNAGISVTEMNINLSTDHLEEYEKYPNLTKYRNGYVDTKKFVLYKLFDKIPTSKVYFKAGDFPEFPVGDNILPLKTSGNNNRGLTRFAPLNCGFTILENEITVAANGNPRAYYIPGKFGILQDAYAIKWIYTDKNISEKVKIFIETAINKILVGRYDWVKKSGWNNLQDDFISLPVTPEGEPDYKFMEALITETIDRSLETKRKKLEQETKFSLGYFGLSQKELVPNGVTAIKEGVLNKDVPLDTLFSIRTTPGLDEGKLRLTNTADETHPYEFVGRTTLNNGVKGYASEQSVAPNPPYCISLSQVGTITAKLRLTPWYSSQNIFALTPKYRGTSKFVLLYLTTLVEFIVYQRFEGGGYTKYPTLKTLRKLEVNIPVTPEGEPDYDFMETYMTAIVKKTIQDKVDRVNKEIEYTETHLIK